MRINTTRKEVDSNTLAPVGKTRIIAIILLSCLAFGLCLKGDFYMDDYLHITGEEKIIDGTWYEKDFRALPFLIWTFAHRLFGFSPGVFHAFNLVVHILAAAVLIPTIRRFLTAGNWLRDDASRLRTATVAALLFAVHPLCSEPVNYTRCLMIGLVNLFTILSVWTTVLTLTSIGRRRAKFAALTLLALLGATFSKSPGVFHAGAAIAITWLLFGQLRPLFSWIRRDTDVLAATATATVLIGKLWPYFDYWLGMVAWQLKSPGFLSHLLTQGRVFWAYLYRFAWPAELSSDHRIQQSVSFADRPATVALSLALILGLAIAVCLFCKRTRLTAAFAALGFVHLYLRFIYNNNEIMVEYRTYPGMPWLCALVALTLLPLFYHRRKIACYLTSLIIVAAVTTSALRSALWTDSSALARDTIERYPANNRARGILMLNLYRAGDYSAVNTIHQQVCAVTDAIEQSNASALSTSGRIYETSRLYLDQAAADRMLALALVEVKGVDFAIKFADFAIDRMIGKRTSAGGYTSKKRIEKSLVDLRDTLLEKGADYEATKNTGT